MRGFVAAVAGPVPGATAVISHRALGAAEEAGRLAVRLTSLLQDLDRHDLLPRELGQGDASERSGSVQTQHGRPSACLSMDVQYDRRTEPFQARNDSGPLSSNFQVFLY